MQRARAFAAIVFAVALAASGCGGSTGGTLATSGPDDAASLDATVVNDAGGNPTDGAPSPLGDAGAADEGDAGTVSGVVAGRSFVGLDFAAENSGPTDASTYPNIVIFVSDLPATACNAYREQSGPPGLQSFHVYLFDDKTQNAIVPGTYWSDPDDAAVFSAFYLHTSDSTCTTRALYSGTGSVTITEISGTHIRGSIDATITDDLDGGVVGHLAGPFDAPICGESDGGDAGWCVL
jgi:hypothetical protein